MHSTVIRAHYFFLEDEPVRQSLARNFWRSHIAAAILSALLVGTLSQPLSAAQSNTTDEPQFMSYAAYHNMWYSDKAAMKCILLNALEDDKAFEKFTFDWYPGLLEPRHFLRIGIGVTYNSRNYNGDLLSLGSKPEGAPGGVGAGVVAQRMPEYRPDEPDPPPRTGPLVEFPLPGTGAMPFLQRYAGNLNKELVDNLESRMGTGRLGSALTHLDKIHVVDPNGNSTSDSGNAATEPPAAGGRAGGRGAAGVRPGEVLDDGDDRAAARGSENEDSEEDPDKSDEESPAKAIPKRNNEKYCSVLPGVVCLNEGKREELVAAAKEQGLDLLIHIDIKVQESRNENFSNTNLRLYNLRDSKTPDKVVIQTKAIKHNVNQNEIDEKSGKNIIGTEIDKFFEEFDKLFVAQPLPGGLKTEHVENRLNGLLASVDDTNRLRIAVEVVAFFRKGLLDEAKATEALDKLFSGGGKLLLTGAPEDRRTFLNKIMDETK